MLKKNKFALLPLILGLCITCLGNFEAEAKDQVELNYGPPVLVQQAYSENRAKRESGKSETVHHIDEDQSGQNTNDTQHGQQINDAQTGQNATDDENEQNINDDQSTQNITDQQSLNKGLSGQNTNDEQQDKYINADQSGQNLNSYQPDQNANDTQAYNINYDDQEGQNINDSLTDDDADVYLPDEHFDIPQTVKQTYWNFYSNKKYDTKQDNQNGTGPDYAYGGRRVQIEIPPELNLRSTAVSNKGGHSLKWHVGIYTKTFTPYMQICGGTLVTLNTVISAAHCFWGLPADQFAVGVGKIYRPWFDAHETYSQTSDISAIHIPPRYRGLLTNFQDDIALVQLTLTLTPSPAVLPACVSFDEGLDEEQLSNRTAGTVMGWGLTQQDGDPSQVLNYVELPPLPVDECFEQAGPDFFKYITSDKICAGVTGQGLCTGDSGGGLVFLDDSSPPVPYLRGVASTAPSNDHACNTAAFTSFTRVFYHRAFLLRHVPRLERDCQRRYKTARVEDKNACRKTTQSIYSPYKGTTTYCDCYTT